MFGTSLEVKLLKAKVNELVGEKQQYKTALETAQDTVSTLESTVARLTDEIKKLNWEMSCKDREYSLAKDKAIGELRLSMQKSLIESDLLRTEAVAKLAIYEKTDNKADSNTIKEMVKQLIEKIGSKDMTVIKS